MQINILQQTEEKFNIIDDPVDNSGNGGEGGNGNDENKKSTGEDDNENDGKKP